MGLPMASTEVFENQLARLKPWPEVDEDLSIDGLIGVKHPCPLAKATR